MPAAQGQQVGYGETVTSRQRPELDPLGIRAAGFLIYPSLAVSEQYNDNILARREEKDDFITFISPGVKARSDWNNHALNFRADANIAKYADNGDEDFEDYAFGTDGRLDITRNQSLFVNALYSHLHQNRGDPDDPQGRNQGEYDLYTITGGYNHRFNRLSVRLEGTGAQYDYDNITADDGSTIRQDVRDRTDAIGTLRAAYELRPGYSAFLLGSYNNRSYDIEFDPLSDRLRSSDGYEVALGAELALTGVTTGEVHVGYRSQFYDDPRFGTIDGITGGASIYWNVTTLTTITGRVERTIEDTTFNTTVGGTPAAGYFRTRYGFIVDHELLRNLLLQASLFGIQEDFNDIDRTDDSLLATVGATYLMNRYLDLSIGYGYRDRSSDFNDYSQNTATLTLKVKL
ncbi:MAG: outer membrane beta-barrel protein [Pseudomonadota bacterium]|nr:outer membrane beta-barrel protein [Pseudomonadota bacterium]